MSKSLVMKGVVERDERNAEARSALYDLLREGLKWRDARKAVFGHLGSYREMDRYTEACESLEAKLNEISPPESKVQAPPTLERALEESLEALEEPYGNKDNRRAQEQGTMRRRRG